MPHTAIIVPCRLESTRFPRKLLHKIKGKPLLLWVAERIARETPEFPLYFAVDHESLREVVAASGFKAIMTQTSHVSGTDRLAEANRQVAADHVINVQADEPMVSAGQIRLLGKLVTGSTEMATLATPFKTEEDFRNPNQVKVVCDSQGRALYFSRAPIPYGRDRQGRGMTEPCYRHLGLYAYKAALLERFSKLPAGRLEQVEKLEQLRVLENGYDIAVGFTDNPTIGVDTLEDAVKFERLLG